MVRGLTTPLMTELAKIHDPSHKGQYAISLSLAELAKLCHIRIDDTAFTLSELGFFKNRREPIIYKSRLRRRRLSADEAEGSVEEAPVEEQDMGEWRDVEVVITRSMVDEQWDKWRVKEKGVLEESCVLL